jgi:hypothetical protein
MASWSGATLKAPPSGHYIIAREFDHDGRAVDEDHAIGDPVLPESRDEISCLARMPKGRRVVVWEDDTGKDGDSFGLFGVVVTRRGTRLGEEFPVNLEHTDGVQERPSIGATHGQFVVAWSDHRDSFDEDRLQIRAQRFDARGSRVGNELLLATLPDEEAFDPAVVALTGDHAGEFVVAWDSVIPYGPSGGDIVARLLMPDGTVSARTILNQNLDLVAQGVPSVAATPSGFIATWTQVTSRDDSEIYARLFDYSMAPLSDEFRVDTTTGNQQSTSDVAVSPTGDFVIDWTTTDENNALNVMAQAFLADGTPLGEPIRLSTKTPGFQGTTFNQAHLTFLNATDFVAVWTDDYGPTRTDVNARLFQTTHDQHLCGDAFGRELVIDTADALAILRAGVGVQSCRTCDCDTNGSGDITATDALIANELAVGLRPASACAPCN